jgi:uncharacterized protein (DUF4415 family)
MRRCAAPTSPPASWCCASVPPAAPCCLKQRVNIFLDGAVIDHFKTKAGARGYQTLINEALKLAVQTEAIEAVVRRTIREELRRG